jgi:acyl carrier protein
MVPSVVVCLDTFPLLPNGKIDVKALPPPDWSGSGKDGYEPPHDELECAIQEIWMQVLNIDDPISVTSDFFAVGGNSLRIGPVSAFIRNELGITLPATAIFNHSTIRRLAKFIEELSDKDSSGNQRNLRSTTVASLRSMVLSDERNPLLNRARTFIKRAEVTLLSAESTRLAELMPEPVRATRLPRPAYMGLQLLFSCTVTSLIPCIRLMIGIVALYWLHLGGSMVSLALILPILYLVFAVVGSGMILLVGKKVLFPRGMRPGIHPLYGWTYLRWITYRALHRATMPVLFPYIRRSRLLPAFFRLLGATIGYEFRVMYLHVARFIYNY